MAHKTKPPFNQWRLEKVALDDLESSVGAFKTDGKKFEFKGRVVFDRCTLPPYTPRKALDRKSFPCHDACFYVFGWKKEVVDAPNHHFSTLKSPPAKHLSTTESMTDISNIKNVTSSSIVPVTASMIDMIRTIHMEYLKRKNEGKFISASSQKRDGSRNKRFKAI